MVFLPKRSKSSSSDNQGGGILSVRSVKAISIIGMMSELDKVVKFCGDSGAFHPDDALSFYSDTRNFVPLADKNPYSAPLQELKNAAELAELKLDYVKLKNFTASPSAVIKYVRFISEKLEKMANTKLSADQAVEACLRKIEQVGHFTGSKINFSEM